MRLQPNTSSSPEVVTSRVDELTDVWLQCDVLRPRGRLSVELRASWEESCRLAQRQVTHAEPITIANVLKTFQEFKAVLVLLSRERSLPPDDVDVDHFIHHGTSAPVRALNALRWMTKNGELNWPLKHARLPEQASSKKLSSQAPVVLPPMLGYLEEVIANKHALADPDWMGLMGSWMIAMGVLRHKHLALHRGRSHWVFFMPTADVVSRDSCGLGSTWRYQVRSPQDGTGWSPGSRPGSSCQNQLVPSAAYVFIRMDRLGLLARCRR